MTLTLHTVSGAPRGWRVLLGLAFKELPATVKMHNTSNGDLKTEDFLALNPRSKIPVLETGDEVLRDSIAALAWLDRKYPGNPLFGEDKDRAGEIWQMSMECCDYLRDAVHALLSRVFPSDGTLPPEDSRDRADLQDGADLMHAECAYLETILSDGRLYLAGPLPSAADAIAYPEVRLLQRAMETKPELMSALGFSRLLGAYPNLAAWKTRLNNDPRVVRTMPPHWTEQSKGEE